jgi:DNA repair exonuclease SbcCD ATPase subunit
MEKAKERHNELYKKMSVPRTLYYVNENNELVNKVEETVNHHKVQSKKQQESCLIKNWNKVKLIEKHRTKREQNKSSIEQKRFSREEKFSQVQQKQGEIQKQFEKIRKHKLKKFSDKIKEIEEQKSKFHDELEKRKKLNLFKRLDQKDNLERERNFYKKFTDRVINKHESISQSVERKRKRDQVCLEMKKKEEKEILKNGQLLVTNYFDAYFEQQKENAKSRRDKERIKSFTGTSGLDLLKILPKISEEKNNSPRV